VPPGFTTLCTSLKKTASLSTCSRVSKKVTASNVSSLKGKRSPAPLR